MDAPEFYFFAQQIPYSRADALSWASGRKAQIHGKYVLTLKGGNKHGISEKKKSRSIESWRFLLTVFVALFHM